MPFYITNTYTVGLHAIGRVYLSSYFHRSADGYGYCEQRKQTAEAYQCRSLCFPDWHLGVALLGDRVVHDQFVRNLGLSSEDSCQLSVERKKYAGEKRPVRRLSTKARNRRSNLQLVQMDRCLLRFVHKGF